MLANICLIVLLFVALAGMYDTLHAYWYEEYFKGRKTALVFAASFGALALWIIYILIGELVDHHAI